MPWAWKNTCSRTWHLCAHSHIPKVISFCFVSFISLSQFIFIVFFFFFSTPLLFCCSRQVSCRAFSMMVCLRPENSSFWQALLTSRLQWGRNREKKKGGGVGDGGYIHIQRPAKDLEASARRASSVCVGQTGDSINILRAIKTTPPARRGVFFFLFCFRLVLV